MLESCKTAQERWGGVDQLIDRWLTARSKLVEHFVTLRDREAPPTGPDERLNTFCRCLLDYVSAGHFSVYEQLVRGAEETGDERALELIRQVIPRIETITQFAVIFNDYYSGTKARNSKEEVMQSRLLKMGGLLHERFELEDCLIEVLHTAYQGSHSVTEKME